MELDEIIKKIEEKVILPTSLSSIEIKNFIAKSIKEKSLFSARTTSQEYLERLKKVLLEYDHNKYNEMQALEKLWDKLNDLGIVEKINGNTLEKMTNLGSNIRLKLIIRTNNGLAENYAKKVQSQDPIFKSVYPAYELKRYGGVIEPRNWVSDWLTACKAVNFKGVCVNVNKFIALVDSPIWDFLGNNFADSIGVNTPPFRWNSQLNWRRVSKKEIDQEGYIFR